MYSRVPRTVLAAALLSFLSLSVGARGQSGQSDQPATQAEQAAPVPGEAMNVVGCLEGHPGNFQLSDEEGNYFRLVGPDLARYVGEEIRVEGTKDASTKPWPSLHVVRAAEVFRAPLPRLSSDFRHPAEWRSEEDRRYGLKYSRPKSAPMIADSPELAPEFPVQDGTVGLGILEIPREVYAGTNFVGGYFRLSVNPNIRNVASCEQFHRSDPARLSTFMIKGVEYASLAGGEGAAGTAYSNRYFHTFQNGLCYELAFDFAEFSTHNLDLWCKVPSLTAEDEWRMIRPLMRGLSFLPPDPPIAPRPSDGTPRVISFTASPTIDDITKQRSTTFSWSTQSADFVELSYDCPKGAEGMVIAEGQEGRGCGGSLDQTFPLKRSANGSVTVDFANFHHDEPVPVRITMTPFREAIPYSELSKSVTVMVTPWNPLPEGAHAGTRNMTVSYLSGAEQATYRQGSSMAIQWTDVEKRDSCINLYLVQDDENGVAAYRARFGEERCLTPASGGSYTWQFPKKYLGSSFRVYAATPGDVSWALGGQFEIVP